MTAKQHIKAILEEMLTNHETGGLQWLHVGMVENLDKLEEFRQIQIIDEVRAASDLVVRPILGVVDVAHVSTEVPAAPAVPNTEPRIVTGYVQPVHAHELVNVAEAFEALGGQSMSIPVTVVDTPDPVPAPAAKKAVKKAVVTENNKE